MISFLVAKWCLKFCPGLGNFISITGVVKRASIELHRRGSWEINGIALHPTCCESSLVRESVEGVCHGLLCHCTTQSVTVKFFRNGCLLVNFLERARSYVIPITARELDGMRISFMILCTRVCMAIGVVFARVVIFPSSVDWLFPIPNISMRYVFSCGVKKMPIVEFPACVVAGYCSKTVDVLGLGVYAMSSIK